ncbi:MAG: TetR/AcrR family transcriptional regulator [Deltaproteobacteria bacterium]|nr:TetR/AcrR family transcriptional regulator [Deltaproteobacteria bacterium]
MVKRPVSTREALLQSALSLIWTQSYGGVSVDNICQAADAKKGSFYHYFESKAALTCAALEYLWEQFRPALDRHFSAQNPPLERFKLYLDSNYREQAAMRKSHGHVVGCPFTSVASEQCAYADGVQDKAVEILARIERYIANALRDAIDEGSLPSVDVDQMARRFLTYELGALSLARVKSDLEPLEGIFEIWMRMAGGRSE